MQTKYWELIQMIERLHRHFLDVVKIELESKNVFDINNVQAMILHNIGYDEMTVGELTLRGYYLGSNVSYNVKKMVENGYLEQKRSVHDKRSIRVRLTEKGQTLYKSLDEMYKKQMDELKNSDLTDDKMSEAIEILKSLERFWNSHTGI